MVAKINLDQQYNPSPNESKVEDCFEISPNVSYQILKTSAIDRSKTLKYTAIETTEQLTDHRFSVVKWNLTQFCTLQWNYCAKVKVSEPVKINGKVEYILQGYDKIGYFSDISRRFSDFV